ncbi:MAG TPA: hypothetical protein DCS55_01060 [Acidimicrobiaceae bacterium]|nr:hypothetical protein [Acidimicrobiaceae bacterium]
MAATTSSMRSSLTTASSLLTCRTSATTSLSAADSTSSSMKEAVTGSIRPETLRMRTVSSPAPAGSDWAEALPARLVRASRHSARPAMTLGRVTRAR